jgi:hypothetical protein
MSANEAKEQAVREIARRHLKIDTLEVRGRDALDFHDCSVESIRAALEAAYTAGFERATKEEK